MKRLTMLVIFIFLIFCPYYSETENSRQNPNPIKSYKDIPGITPAEITAIEALIAQKGKFSYGHLIGTESFQREDGKYTGFAVNVCERLSVLFDTEFVAKHYTEWEALKSDIDRLETDFSGEFTPTAERMKIYHMTMPIAGRGLSLYTLTTRNDIEKEADINGRRIGFLVGTVAAKMIKERYRGVFFEPVEAVSFAAAAKMLQSGEIDAFITDRVADVAMGKYDFVKSRPFFHFIYSPVSITTKNPALQPIISAINKYLNAGGIEDIFKLYSKGNTDYKKYKLYQSFTDEEKAYLEKLKTTGAKINVALQHDAYPASFYNKNEKRYQGAAADILEQVSELTGIVFDSTVMPIEKPLSDILAKLKKGEVAMMPQLLYSESRKNDYIWSSVSYITTHFALLSKSEYPTLEPFQVYYARVGTVNKSVHEEIFHEWFPGHDRTIVYKTGDEGFDALENGEIDLLMLSETMLLVQTNYSEKPGYKINISFDQTLDTLFGFNKEEVILRNIFDKTLNHIDVKGIENYWLSRTFDYTTKMSQMQANYLMVFSGGILIVLAVILFLFARNRRLGQNLLKSTTSLTTIYKSIPDIVFSMDTNLIYTSCNPGFEKMAGKTQAEIIGKTDEEVFGPDKEMVAFFTQMNKKVVETQKMESVKEWVVYPDGSQRFLETIKTPLFQDGEFTGLMGIARDITELNTAVEEAREASKVKSMFLANMSHEIRTPMNAIIGMTDLLINEPLTERQQSYVKDVNAASHSLLEIINDILDLSKIESGKMELNPVHYDFQAFISNMNSIFTFLAGKKGLAYKFEQDGDLPKCLYGDDIRLRQVLMNICGNAVKFTDTGLIQLNITVKDGMIALSITDSGIGIRDEDLPGLFNAFTQSDIKKNRNIVGTGLGLPISKSFVEMMGGDISVTSTYGHGSTFTIVIPEVIGDETQIRYEDTTKEKDGFCAPSAKILVVDDNEMNLKVASGLLNIHEITATTASSGKEALQLVQETDFDIVFMDHMMPEMDGIETTGKIRALGGKYEKLIIMALTANAIRGAREMFLANGFNGFVSKPIDHEELTETLRKMLPPAKIEKCSKSEPAKPNTNSGQTRDTFLESVGQISGINPQIGLSRFAGMKDLYCETAEIFFKKLLSECEKMDGFLKSNDLRNLAVLVHSIKSTLATIGALERSEAAAKLEAASKSDDLNYCEQHLPGFLEDLRSLHEQLAAIMPEKKTSAPKIAGDTAYLLENIHAAIAAVDDFERDLASEALDKLLAYDFGEQTNELLANANNALEEFDLDSAGEFLKKIMENHP